jgi:hypothetical protein
VLQLIPTSIIIWLATVISLAVGTYCKQSNSVHFAHIWITILKVVVTVIAVVNCLRFYGRFKKILKQHGVILKLFTFKGIIGINVFQTVRSPLSPPRREEILLTRPPSSSSISSQAKTSSNPPNT